MSQMIQGSNFQYFIDADYGMNKGFIAEGTESIVYKGVKRGGSLKCSCALKFKPKERLGDFMRREYKIMESMQTCRSIVRVLDVIEDLGNFTWDYIDKESKEIIKITREHYFCVVEEYIDGESLQDYCIHQWFDYDEEKKVWKKKPRKYAYREIVKFQNQILQFMINLCEIMKFVSNVNADNGKTDPNKPIVLHCDIKPENIMVTKHGKELVLIDFGRSQQIKEGNKFQYYNDPENKKFEADYSGGQWRDEGKENFYAYGTVGYAAPECYAESEVGKGTFPFITQRTEMTSGLISIESDIFGFGTTFRECFAIFELCQEAFNSNEDPSDSTFFNNFLSKQAEENVQQGNTEKYCDRDFEGVSSAYHERLEDIIRKCTHVRCSGFQEPEPNDIYYHNFYELQAEIEGARNIIPPLDRKTDPMVNQVMNLSLTFLDLGIGFLILFLILILFANLMANSQWKKLTKEYTQNKTNTLMTVADEMTSTVFSKSNYKNFEKILSFMYGGAPNDKVIDEEETSILTSLLEENLNDYSKWGGYMDEIMQHCKSEELDNVSEKIYMMNLPAEYESIGYEIAKAVYQVNKADEIDDADKLCSAYNTLMEYAELSEYRQVTSSLAFKLMTGSKIDTIAAKEETDRDTIQNNLTMILNLGGD